MVILTKTQEGYANGKLEQEQVDYVLAAMRSCTKNWANLLISVSSLILYEVNFGNTLSQEVFGEEQHGCHAPPSTLDLTFSSTIEDHFNTIENMQKKSR